MYGSPMDAWGQGYEPMVRGTQHTPLTGFEGLPLMTNPVVGTLAPFLAPSAQQWMQNAGMSPMGLSGRNPADVMKNMRYTEHQNEVLRRAAENDRENIQKTLRGASAMAGKTWDGDKQKAADTFADSYVAMAPLLSMSPDALDAVTGGTGEAAFAIGVTSGGRYRQDPMTGMQGMSTDSTSHLTSGLRNAYFENGKFDRSKNHGFTSGQMGTMFDELSRRGMIAGTGSAREAAMGGLSMLERGDKANFEKIMTDTLGETRAKEVMANAKKAGGDATQQLKLDEVEKLAGTSEGTDAIKALDVAKVKGSMDKYAKSLAAMRDIFGDAGHPNAPIPELMKSLEAMTNGSLQTMDPGKAEMLVRKTYAMAKSSGIGLEGAMVMQQHAAQAAQQAGLMPAFAPQLGLAGMAALQSATQTGTGGWTAWGAANSEQLSQAMVNRTARATGSELANRMGAIEKLDERMKLAGGPGFAADSNMGKMMAAMKEGRTSFEFTGEDGKTVTRSVLDFAGRKNMREFIATMEKESGGRLTNQDLREQERDRFGNQEVLAKNEGIGEAVGELSREETDDNKIKTKVAASLHSRLKNKGTASQRNAVALQLASHMSSSTGDPAQDIEAMTKILRDSGMTDGMTDEQVKMMAAAQFTTINNARADAGLHNATVERQLNNGEFRAGYRRSHMQASIEARERSALTGLGANTSFITRLVSAVQAQGDKPADPEALKKVLMESLGGVDNEEISAALRAPLESFAAAQDVLKQRGEAMTKLGVEEPILPTDSVEEKARKEAANKSRKEAKRSYDESAMQLGAAQQTLHKEMRKHATVSAAMDGTENGSGGEDSSGVEPAKATTGTASGGMGWLGSMSQAMSFSGGNASLAAAHLVAQKAVAAATGGSGAAAGPSGGGQMELSGKLVISRDGTGTITGTGTPRGAVPTGVT